MPGFFFLPGFMDILSVDFFLIILARNMTENLYLTSVSYTAQITWLINTKSRPSFFLWTLLVPRDMFLFFCFFLRKIVNVCSRRLNNSTRIAVIPQQFIDVRLLGRFHPTLTRKYGWPLVKGEPPNRYLPCISDERVTWNWLDWSHRWDGRAKLAAVRRLFATLVMRWGDQMYQAWKLRKRCFRATCDCM